MERFKKVTLNIKKYLILYSIIVIAVGWSLSIPFGHYASVHKPIFSNLIVLFVFFMIYPMMINMDWGKTKEIAKDPKAVLMSLVYNYAITPIIAFILAKLFIHNNELALGFMLVMLIPVSSSSVGYTGIAKGSVEIAMIAQAINFALIPVLAPLYLSFIARGSNIIIPMNSILKSILIVVILPMVLGYITRVILVKAGGKDILKKIKPIISFTTLISMLLVIITIFFLKGHILSSKLNLLLILGVLTLIYIVITLFLETFIDKKMKMSYKEHMGIVFLSTGKNNGTAVAIATMAFGPMVAIPAAILPVFQIILLIGYLHMENIIKRYFGAEKESDNI